MGTREGPLVQIKDSIVTGGTYNIFATRNNDQPQSVKDIVAFDALLNAGERYPAPKCHPGTRKAALEIVESWIWNRGVGFKSIMWVSGAPGVGKSAILQTICEALAGMYNPIHASFFFARGQGARELASSLAPTIAYQFTLSSIVCRWYIWYLVRSDPAVLREASDSQFRKLVITPAVARSYVQYPMVVVIDGLDECISAQDRILLLKLIFEAAKTTSIRFLIASRPEQEIETFFKDLDVAQHVDHIVLDEENFKTSKDIRILLRSEFARIRQSRPHLTFPLVDGKEWPGDAVVDRATVDSDGQFIFATLFVGYLDDEFSSPQEQLESLLNPPSHVAAFSKLDQLYHQILTRRLRHLHQTDAKLVQYQETVKAILRAVVAWPEQLSCSGVARVLGEEVHVIQNIVRGPLRTLFKFQGSDPDSNIAFCHKSFGDCLSDPRRSGEFHVPPNTLDLLYHRFLSRLPPSDPARSFSRDQLVAVLQVFAVWPDFLTEDKIASLAGLDRGAVKRVLTPFMDSLLEKRAHGPQCTIVRAHRHPFKRFLLDPNRSQEFHTPPNALDILYLRILSGPPLSKPNRAFSREQFLEVLHVLVVFPGPLTSYTISSVLGLHKNTVDSIIHSYAALPFRTSRWSDFVRMPTEALRDPVLFVEPLWDTLRDFLLDPHRSGELHVPPNVFDSLYLRILSNPPLPDSTGMDSRKEVIKVLHLIVASQQSLTVDEIFSVLDLPSDIVTSVVAPLTGLLFNVEKQHSGHTDLIRNYWANRDIPDRFFKLRYAPSRVSSIPSESPLAQPMAATADKAFGWKTIIPGLQDTFRNFMTDPRRSGEFHVPPDVLDVFYLHILSHSPSSQMSRKHLFQILHTIVVWPGCLTVDKIASILQLDRATVSLVTMAFEGWLFEEEELRSGVIKLRWDSFKGFMLDPCRSGEFHVPSNTLDRIFLRILSYPPPSDPTKTFSQEQLRSVLHTSMDHLTGTMTSDTSSTVVIDADVVRNVIFGPQRPLFTTKDNGSVRLFHRSLASFLSDASRSGRFYNPRSKPFNLSNSTV